MQGDPNKPASPPSRRRRHDHATHRPRVVQNCNICRGVGSTHSNVKSRNVWRSGEPRRGAGRGTTKKAGPLGEARLWIKFPKCSGRKLAAEGASAETADASVRGRGVSRGVGGRSVRRRSVFDHFAAGAAAIATGAARAAAAAAAVAARAAVATAVAALEQATMATAVAATMATAVATTMATAEQATVAAAAAAIATRAAAAAITAAARAIARATAAVTGNRLAGPADERQANHREKHRDAQNQCTIHPRILQKQQVPYRKGCFQRVGRPKCLLLPQSGRPTQRERLLCKPVQLRLLFTCGQWPLTIKQDVVTAQARSLG